MKTLLFLLGLLLGLDEDALRSVTDERLAALEATDVGRWSEAFEALSEEGEASALRALETFAEADVQGARSRARLIADVGGPACIPAVLSLLEHPDPEVRHELVRFLGGHALGESAPGQRVRVLALRAQTDASQRVRREALRALASSGLPGAAEALDELIDRMPSSDLGVLVEALVACPGARGRIVARVLDGFAAAAGETDPKSFARLVRAYGRALADTPRGGQSARERVPFVRGRTHPSELVRAAAGDALDGMLDRLVELSEVRRADELLASLGRDGLGVREILYRRSILALAGRDAADEAASHAARLLAISAGDDTVARTWRFYAQHFAAAAELARGRAVEAYDGFGRAAETLRGLIAEREDLRPRIETRPDFPIAPLGAAVVVDRLQLLALVETWQALAIFERNGAQGIEPLELSALRHLREAHRTLLEAQLLALEKDAEFGASHTLDDLFDRELSPRRLLLNNRELDGWIAGSGIDLQLLLGRAFASVAPDELPGFEPARTEERALFDPFLDDERFLLLQRIQAADLESARRAWLYERGRLFERSRDEDDPALTDRQTLLRHPLRLRLLDAQRTLRTMSDRIREFELVSRGSIEERRTLYAELSDFRPPSEYALTLSAELRADGRATEARELSESMLAAVKEGLDGTNSVAAEILSARLELSIASSFTDEDRPRESERMALAAVKRLEAFENTIETRIDEELDSANLVRLERSLRQVQRMRSSALLSLAVNANVRMGDPRRALEYFERGYELDQRDFMRALLACYRARSGKSEEARAVLRTLQPSPPLYYNLACTHALLGDAETALDFLTRELDENHPAPGSRRRQQEWAREDPDLSSLREDPRFQRLVGE